MDIEPATNETPAAEPEPLLPLCTREQSTTDSITYWNGTRPRTIALEQAFLDLLYQYAERYNLTVAAAIRTLAGDAAPAGVQGRIRVELLFHERRRLTEAVRRWVLRNDAARRWLLRKRLAATFEADIDPEPRAD